MRKTLLLLFAAAMLGASAGNLRAAPARSYEARQLKKQHKGQGKALKQQQRAMKKVMGQHQLSADERDRFNNNLKMQKRLLHKRQKNESREARHSGKAATHAPAAAS
jgi:small-conductance mechanosensitive channel